MFAALRGSPYSMQELQPIPTVSRISQRRRHSSFHSPTRAQLPDYVVEAFCEATQTQVIAKLLRKKKSKELSILRALSPIRSALNHVVPLVDTIPSPHGLLIILPQATTLPCWYQLYQTVTPPPRADAERICHELIEGVAFLHQNGTAHLDINPINLVLRRGDARLFITNFDVSVRCKDEKEMVRLSCRTSSWLAPEIFLDNKNININKNIKKPTRRVNPIRADLWSCGAVLGRICRRTGIQDGDILRLSSLLMDDVASRRPLLYTIGNGNEDRERSRRQIADILSSHGHATSTPTD
jgi:serine/threonine protein kinase